MSVIKRRVLVTGATGMIGRVLGPALQAHGYEVIVLSRDPNAAKARIPGMDGYLAWSPGASGSWIDALNGASAIIHLAGAAIAGQRWTPAYKREILESRVQGTRTIVDAIRAAVQPPAVLICSSGVDYYGDCGERLIDESAAAGTGFLSQVCIAWEQAAMQAEAAGVRVACMRTGIVLDRQEGALAKLLLPFQFGVGGPVLPGSQWWSWIHLNDVVGLMLFALEHGELRGGVNLTAPEPVRNRVFAATLGKVLGRPAFLPTPTFALKIIIGEMAIPLLIEKQRAIPKKALDAGYQFQYPQLEPALRAVLR